MSMFHHSRLADMSTLANLAAQNALPRRGSMVAKLEAKAALTLLPKRTPLPTLPQATEKATPVLTVLPPVAEAAAPTETWGNASSKIVVIGAGGAGGNAVGRMVDQPTTNLKGIRFAVANTDAQALKDNVCELKLNLGPKVTRGLGAGGNAEVGSKAAEESTAAIEELIGDADLVFVTLGLGGGTGSGAAPVIARVARAKGAVVVAIATLPFKFEGDKRAKAAEAALEHLRAHADTVVVVNNNALLSIFPKDQKKITLPFAFSVADQCLQQAVDGMVGIIQHDGYINLDFADVRTTLQQGGRGYFGMGMAEGEHAASKAMVKAMSHQLLGDTGIAGATKVLVYFKGNPGMKDIDDAMERLNEQLAPDTSTIFGWGMDPELGEQVEVTLFAVGIDPIPTTTPPAAVAISVPATMPTQTVKAEKTERVDAATALVEVAAEPAAPIRTVYTGSFVDKPASKPVDVFVTPAPQPQAHPTTNIRAVTEGRKIRSVDGDDNVPPFLLGNRGQRGKSVPNFGITTDQTDHTYSDDLDIPAFLRRRGLKG